jgi:hypothetical protein
MLENLIYTQMRLLLGLPASRSAIDYASGFIQNFIQSLLGGWFWLFLVIGVVIYALFSRSN